MRKSKDSVLLGPWGGVHTWPLQRCERTSRAISRTAQCPPRLHRDHGAPGDRLGSIHARYTLYLHCLSSPDCCFWHLDWIYPQNNCLCLDLIQTFIFQFMWQMNMWKSHLCKFCVSEHGSIASFAWRDTLYFANPFLMDLPISVRAPQP